MAKHKLTIAKANIGLPGLQCWEAECRRSVDVVLPLLKTKQHYQSRALYCQMTNTGWLRSTVGRTPVFCRRTDPVLRSACSWRVSTMWVKPSAAGQPTRPTQPFILPGSIMRSRPVYRCASLGGAIWWMPTGLWALVRLMQPLSAVVWQLLACAKPCCCCTWPACRYFVLSCVAGAGAYLRFRKGGGTKGIEGETPKELRKEWCWNFFLEMLHFDALMGFWTKFWSVTD